MLSFSIQTFCAALLILAPLAQASAECIPQWLPGDPVPGVDGPIEAVLPWDPDGEGPAPELLIVGGSITEAGGRPARMVAAWDGEDWAPVGDFPGSFVNAMVQHENAVIVAAGSRVWRWDGTSWQPLGASFSSAVRSLGVYNGTLIAGGGFQNHNGNPMRGVAYWDGTAWQPLGTGPSTGDFLAFQEYEGDLIGAGSFRFAGNPSIWYVARWDGTTWHPMGERLDGFAHSLVIHEGQLLVGGAFGASGSATIGRIAQWTGSHWESYETPVGPIILERLFTAGGDLFGSGSFNDGNGGYTLARWKNGIRTPFPSERLASVRAMTIYRDQLYAAAFDTLSDRTILRWNGQRWQRVGRGMSAPVLAIVPYGDGVVAAGEFESAGDDAANRIARFENGFWESLAEGVGGGVDPQVRALTVLNGDLIAGGRMQFAGDATVHQVARWDGETWHALGTGGWGFFLEALTTHNGSIIASGDGPSGERVARWDGASWTQLGPSFNGPVRALTSFEGSLIAGGEFYEVGGTPMPQPVRWNGVAWESLGNMGATAIHAFTVYGGELIAGGWRLNVARGNEIGVAAWDGTAWRILGDSFNGAVRALAVGNGDLFIGGGFTNGPLPGLRYVGRWDGSQWSLIPSELDDSVTSLAYTDGVLYVGGEFKPNGDADSAYFARWRCTNPGDLNCNSVVSVGDIAAFVGALTNPTAYAAEYPECNRQNADVNEDGVISVGDIAAFVALLTQ